MLFILFVIIKKRLKLTFPKRDKGSYFLRMNKRLRLFSVCFHIERIYQQAHKNQQKGDRKPD
ncbi:hypothetical protein D0T87_11875 [Bacteroides sp. 51]|nr:hypothetical protein [Bacteroides sp. 51]